MYVCCNGVEAHQVGCITPMMFPKVEQTITLPNGEIVTVRPEVVWDYGLQSFSDKMDSESWSK